MLTVDYGGGGGGGVWLLITYDQNFHFLPIFIIPIGQFVILVSNLDYVIKGGGGRGEDWFLKNKTKLIRKRY